MNFLSNYNYLQQFNSRTQKAFMTSVQISEKDISRTYNSNNEILKIIAFRDKVVEHFKANQWENMSLEEISTLSSDIPTPSPEIKALYDENFEDGISVSEINFTSQQKAARKFRRWCMEKRIIETSINGKRLNDLRKSMDSKYNHLGTAPYFPLVDRQSQEWDELVNTEDFSLESEMKFRSAVATTSEVSKIIDDKLEKFKSQKLLQKINASNKKAEDTKSTDVSISVSPKDKTERELQLRLQLTQKLEQRRKELLAIKAQKKNTSKSPTEQISNAEKRNTESTKSSSALPLYSDQSPEAPEVKETNSSDLADDFSELDALYEQNYTPNNQNKNNKNANDNSMEGVDDPVYKELEPSIYETGNRIPTQPKGMYPKTGDSSHQISSISPNIPRPPSKSPPPIPSRNKPQSKMNGFTIKNLTKVKKKQRQFNNVFNQNRSSQLNNTQELSQYNDSNIYTDGLNDNTYYNQYDNNSYENFQQNQNFDYGNNSMNNQIPNQDYYGNNGLSTQSSIYTSSYTQPVDNTQQGYIPPFSSSSSYPSIPVGSAIQNVLMNTNQGYQDNGNTNFYAQPVSEIQRINNFSNPSTTMYNSYPDNNMINNNNGMYYNDNSKKNNAGKNKKSQNKENGLQRSFRNLPRKMNKKGFGAPEYGDDISSHY